MNYSYLLDPLYRPGLDNMILVLTLFVSMLVKTNYDFVWFCGAERHLWAKGESTQRLRYCVVTLGAIPALAGAVWMLVIADWNVGIIIRNTEIWRDQVGFMGWCMTLIVVITALTPFVLALSYWEIYRHPAILAKRVGKRYAFTDDVRKGVSPLPLAYVHKVRSGDKLHREYILSN